MKRFTSILIANRGEIACRVISTAQKLGYKTIAVYSEADEDAPHVQLADDAVLIGAGPVADSYLDAQKILQAAADSGAEAIHPGYGFLSENADFADAVAKAGMTFIGPSREAVEVMGNKGESKRRMIEAGVPCIPGYEGHDQTDKTLLAEGKKIELPLMVKAAAGGGGRGMRLVHDYKDLANAIKLARAEAEGAFGSGELILEKAIIEPRHVEIQVFADNSGHTIHLGERDCSVQRRHQKVVEEAPCPVMTPALRERMGVAAIEAAKSVNYCGAGTVEFLLDANGSFYFLEMNTRLQVEHPVTELITGLDLVALQISVAQGEPLGLDQEDIVLNGHAMEVRLYTEDPSQDFLPASGPVDLWLAPCGEGVRVDAGIVTGQEISPFYDPMVAKIIAYGPSRDVARQRLLNALKKTVLFGTSNNREFLIDCLSKASFIEGRATTAFIGETFSEAQLQLAAPNFADCACAAVIEQALEYEAHYPHVVGVSESLKDWTTVGQLVVRKKYQFDDIVHDLSIFCEQGQRYRVVDGEQSITVELQGLSSNHATLRVNGSCKDALFMSPQQGQLYCSVEGREHFYQDLIITDGVAVDDVGGGRVIAPMHGLLLEVLVAAGDSVKAGQTVAVLEAMKMHYEIVAEIDGEVLEVMAEAGHQVAADALLIEIEALTETE